MDQEAILAMLHDLSTRIDEAPRKVKPDRTVSVTNRTSSKQSEVLSPYWSCISVDKATWNATEHALAGAVGSDWDQLLTDYTGPKLEYSIPTGDGFLLLPNYEIEHIRAVLVFTNSGAPFTQTIKVMGNSGGVTSYAQFKVNSTVYEYGVGDFEENPSITFLTGRNRIAFTIASFADTFLNGCIKGKILVDGRTTWIKGNE